MLHIEMTAYFLCSPLPSGNCSSRKGFNGACSVHEYSGSFQGQSVHFKMTSVCGHVMSLDFIGGYFPETPQKGNIVTNWCI